MIDRRNAGRAVRGFLLGTLVSMGGLASVPAAPAQEIPVPVYVSPPDDGSGGGVVHLTSPFAAPGGTVVLPVWADGGLAAEGQGVFSIQDVLIRSLTPNTLVLVDFSCTAPACEVGPRPDPDLEVLLAAGDDTSPTATLSGPFRIGYLTVGGLGGEVGLVAGTALDADGHGAALQIEALENEGTLVRFLPEPAGALPLVMGTFAIGLLAGRRPRSR